MLASACFPNDFIALYVSLKSIEHNISDRKIFRKSYLKVFKP